MKEATIDLGKLSLPTLEYASQGNAILGIRDSGKSYSATFLAEQLLDAGIPFIAFDPIGVWRFLKVPGAGKGYPVVVASAEDGDLPLTADNAAEIVRAAMTKNVPLVLDLYSAKISKSDWRKIVESSVRVLLFENKTHGLRHIFVEEAAEFVPQRVGPEQGKVYGIMESLARMGGNAKLGYTLINQRAEEVNKAVLELCDCLFLHRQKGRNSLTALSKWLDFGDKAKTRGVIEGISKARAGECWIWPRAQETPVHVHMPRKNSFHPDRRAETHTAAKAAVPVEKFVASLKDSLASILAAEVEEKDLRKRIAELERELKHQRPAEPEKVFVLRETELREIAGNLEHAKTFAGAAMKLVEHMEKCLEHANGINGTPPRVPSANVEIHRQRLPSMDDHRSPQVSMDGNLKGGEKRILETIAAHHPVVLTFSQIGTLAGYTPSTMRTYMPALRSGGWVQETSDGIILTDSAWKEFGGKKPAPKSKEEIRALWFSRLSEGEGNVLGALLRYQREMTVEQICSETGYTPSTVRTYIPTLRRNKLILSDRLQITPDLL